MSNLEKDPAELVCAAEPASTGIQILEPRDVPLGGVRAMTVRRTLPQRRRSLIGAWCFLDHYGPDDVTRSGGMDVPPHPHTGLQTVSWLFQGEIEHRDSVGSVAMVRPGEVNLMTAGRGIQHSEVSTGVSTGSTGGATGSTGGVLHGAQLWVALPDGSRFHEPFFEHYVPEPVAVGDATLRVFAGSLAGASAELTVFSDLVGAQLDLPAGGMLDLGLDPAFEHGVLLDHGALRLDGGPLPLSHLAYLETGRTSVRLQAGDEPVTALLIGGRPFDEQIVMWWNFIGRSHDEVVAFREQWQAEVIGRADPDGRFGHIDGAEFSLPAPELPNVRLRPRE